MIAKEIAKELSGSSLIREMFEKGLRLKAQFGPENVFDFSLGNPDLPAPPEIAEALKEAAVENDHAYMANAGYPELRARIAENESEHSGKTVESSGIIMTVGAAGALNVCLKALLDPGDEVIILTPYFPEYLTYIKHCGGVPRIVDCSATNFMPNLPAIEAAICEKTKAILLNSPNNPCGRVYPAPILDKLNDLLLKQSQSIYVLADEPYAEINFMGETPSPIKHFKNVLRIYSWSKSFSLPGERIGYVAIPSECDNYEMLCAAIIYLNRSLGFVNAPALWQQVLLTVGKLTCPAGAYESRLDALRDILLNVSLVCPKPEGSFYLFPKTPTSDDKAFVNFLSEFNILAVPGSAFGASGYMRLSTCVPKETISGSAQAFEKAMQAWKTNRS